jgi:hypothetical protein
MTWLGSRETREARLAAQEADDAARQHQHFCIECTRAARQRRPADRCAEGRKLAEVKRQAAEQLRAERKLDKLPAPGQEPLFGLDALAGGGHGT